MQLTLPQSGGIVLGIDETRPNTNLEQDWKQYRV